MKIFKLNKENLITILFMVLSLVGYIFFPAKGYFQSRVVAIVFLVALPFLYSKFILKRENIFKKLIIGDWRKNLLYLTASLILAALIMISVFKYTSFLNHYILPINVKNNFKDFLIYEFLGVSFSVAVYELFFRGFVFFYFNGLFKRWAILIQFLFFIGMLLLLNMPFWFYVVYLIFAPFAGWITYKSDSLLYSFIGQLIFIIIIDASFIVLSVK